MSVSKQKISAWVQAYILAALDGKEGVDISKAPRNLENEQNFAKAEGMTPEEAKAFDAALKEEFSEDVEERDSTPVHEEPATTA